MDDYDRLAAGSLAGHVIECGAQATGGIFTDWRLVAEGWADMGFPIAECEADGAFVLDETGGDGRACLARDGRASRSSTRSAIPPPISLPDVACDWTHVRLEQVGADRVRVTGARGAPPPATYKVSATYPDGFRAADDHDDRRARGGGEGGGCRAGR